MRAGAAWVLPVVIAIAAPASAADIAFPALPSLIAPWRAPAAAPTIAGTGAHADRVEPGMAMPHDEARCLAQAVYYEAATEPRAGQEAVAQVVLNRMHHPSYPKSICGVVYQGSVRSTGCQFTFTCDGSLARGPVPRLWKEAEDVASQALRGFVASGLAQALNYHADYVAPRWRNRLVRVTQIGAHIFYRPPTGGEPIGGVPSALAGAAAGSARIASISVWGITIATVGRGGAVRSVVPAAPAMPTAPAIEAVAAVKGHGAG